MREDIKGLVYTIIDILTLEDLQSLAHLQSDYKESPLEEKLHLL